MSTSEYLQMAGRAGRRGKDERGFSLLCADPQFGGLPSHDEFQELLDSQGVELESKSRFDYRSCLNVLKTDEGEIGSLLQQSFLANENTTVKLNAIKEQKHLTALAERSKQIACVYGVPGDASRMYKLITEMWETCYKLNINFKPEVLSIVEVLTAKHIFKPMVVLRLSKNSGALCLFIDKAGDSWPLAYEEKGKGEFEDAKRKSRPKTVSLPSGELYSYEYVQVEYEMITRSYSDYINSLDGVRLAWLSEHQLNEK